MAAPTDKTSLPEDMAHLLQALKKMDDDMEEMNEIGWCPGRWSLGAVAARLPPAPFELASPPGPVMEIFPLKFWYRLSYHFAIAGVDNLASPLTLKASREHVVAYNLLHDWWTAKYQDPAFSESAIDSLTENWPYEIVETINGGRGKIAARITEEYLRLRTTTASRYGQTAASKHTRTVESETTDRKASYDIVLWDSFFYEFIMESCYNPHREADDVHEYRASLRKKGAVLAYVQYLSWSTFEKELSLKESLASNDDAQNNVSVVEAGQRGKHSIRASLKRISHSVAIAAHRYSRRHNAVEPKSTRDQPIPLAALQPTNSNVAQPGQSQTPSNTSHPGRQKVVPTGSPAPNEDLNNNDSQFDIGTQGPIWNPCPWSTMANVMDELHDFPRYLWDRQHGRTVIVSELLKSNTFSDYIAISHTWGRWYKEKPIAIEGVPWLVPQNSRFDVQDLHQILRSIPSELRYIWMDLLCIPQDRSEEGAREISRQAKIFRLAGQAMAWFADVESFDGLGKVLDWWTLELLVVHGNEKEKDRVALKERAWSAIYGTQTGLLQPRSGPFTVDVRGLNPWFTSLWTLQEVCLRPDMLLCARDWKPLTCHGSSPIPLSGLVAVIKTRNQAIKQRAIDAPISQIPVAIFELRLWDLKSELYKLLDLDRASIITLGDRRVCTERRAEAIMSALGTVNWYDKALSDYGPENLHKILETDLVLGKYPLAFLNELATEVPLEFFGSFRRSDVKATPGGPSIWSTLPNEGTMMPFCRTEAFFADGRLLRHERFGASITTHPSLQTWRVEQSGAARLPKVCMISSKDMAAEALAQKKLLPGLVSANSRKPSSRAILPHDVRAKLGDYFNATEQILEHGFFDLHAWVAESPCEVYAVVGSYLRFKHEIAGVEVLLTACAALILERVDGDLVRAGDALLVDTESNLDLKYSREVNWLIV